MANVSAMIALLFTPIRAAAVGLSDKARIAQAYQQDYRDREYDHLLVGNQHTPEVDPVFVRDHFRKRLRRCAKNQLRRVFQEERNPDGSNQHDQPRSAPERPIGEELDEYTNDRATNHAGDQNDRASHDVMGTLHRWHQPAGEIERDEGAHHEDVAVREIDESQHPIHHRVTEGDQRINHPK
jgi:hypothetical protein